LRSSDVKAYLLPVVSLLRFCGMRKHGRTNTAQGYMMVEEQKNEPWFSFCLERSSQRNGIDMQKSRQHFPSVLKIGATLPLGFRHFNRKGRGKKRQITM
jgi:hypothetical protein